MMQGVTCLNIAFYGRLYKTLLSVYGMPEPDALNFVYMLNTANLDTCRAVTSRSIAESSPRFFMRTIQKPEVGPPAYTRHELYWLLERVSDNIIWTYLVEKQRAAYRQLLVIQNNLIYRHERDGHDELTDLLF